MCNEVWGGNRKVVRTVQLASVTAWMASVPLDEGEGGRDLYYMSVCNHGLISRVALADVSGHGRVVSAMTETLQKLMHENIDVWDQSDFMRGLNETFALSTQNKYATAIVLSIDRITGRLAFSNAGHLPPLWYHARPKKWGWRCRRPFGRTTLT
jgi:phosphoserine phosphatase RsbU/P